MTHEEFVKKWGGITSTTNPQLSSVVYTAQGPVSRAQYEQMQKGPQKPRGRGGILSSLISETGGIGGALGGAAAGAALGSVVPVIGTGIGGIAGAILGGFGGGTVGRGIENKVRDNQNFFGKGGSAKAAFGEGALSGALAGAGEGFQLLKGAKALGIPLAEASRLAPGELRAAQAAKGLSKVGGDLVAESRGLTPAAKAGGRTLSTAQAQSYNDYLSTISKAKNPAKILADLENHIATTGSSMNNLVAQSNRALTKTEVQAVKDSLTAAINKVPGLGAEKPAVQQYIKDLANVKDLSGLHEFVQGIGEQAKYTPNAAQTVKMNKALQNMYRAGTEAVNGHVQGLADLKSTYATARNVLPFAQQAVTNPNALKVPGLHLSKLGGVEVGGKAGATARAAVGGALGSAGSITGKIPASAKLIAGAGLTKALGGTQEPPQPGQVDQASQYNANPTSDQFLGVDPAQFGYPADNTVQGAVPQSPYSLQNALQDIQRDPKNQAAYLNLYKTVNAAQAAPKQSAAQTARSDSLRTALASLEGAGQNLTAAGGAQGPRGNLSTIPGIGQYLDPQGAAYHNTKIEIATQMAKAITGGSRPAQSVIERYLHSLPDVNDPPAYAEAKINKLRNELLVQARAFGYGDIIDQYQETPQYGLSSALQGGY